MKIKFNVPIYDHDVVFFDSAVDASAYIGEEAWLFSSWTNNRVSVITVDLEALKCGHFDPKYLQTLSHECCHSAIDILNKKGIAVNYENQETFCYLQDFIIRKILDGIKRNENKNS